MSAYREDDGQCDRLVARIESAVRKAEEDGVYRGRDARDGFTKAGTIIFVTCMIILGALTIAAVLSPSDLEVCGIGCHGPFIWTDDICQCLPEVHDE